MSEIVPLFLLWLFSQRGGGARAPSVPQWPTAASPPPPLPAFTPHAAATANTADTGTPLSQLHQTPPTPAHASSTATTAPKPKPKSAPPPSAARRAASAASRAVHAATTKLPGLPSLHASSPPLKAADVLSLQRIINSRGGKLKPDGLYGPKTASAWSALAKQMGLPTTISRVGPKVARVAIQTFDTLSVPPIP